jgi:hypothetical protein
MIMEKSIYQIKIVIKKTNLLMGHISGRVV